MAPIVIREHRHFLIVDKPAGWLVAPEEWDKTRRNLQRALLDAIRAGEHWARSRNLRFLRFLHRLDAETSGVLLLAKNPGVVSAYSRLFALRKIDKVYLAVVRGIPRQAHWRCQLSLSPVAGACGRMTVDPRHGKAAITEFSVLQTGRDTSLLQARPLTGRTHQIRVHLAAGGYPVVHDPLYGNERVATEGSPENQLALRAIRLEFVDPFRKCRVRVLAPARDFVVRHGFSPKSIAGLDI